MFRNFIIWKNQVLYILEGFNKPTLFQLVLGYLSGLSAFDFAFNFLED